MPLIQSAKKKLRKDKKRTLTNLRVEKKFKKVLGEIKKGSAKKSKVDLLKKAYSVLDRAVKSKIMHKNKASRLKSHIAKKFSKK